MRRFRLLLATAIACAALSAPVAVAQEKKPTATGSGGAAASVDPLATNAAVDVLRRGGNAFDTGSTTAPNRAQGGRRPRSSIAPTIVTRGGRPFMTVGSPGGASIITTVLQILLNRIDFGMSLPDAIAAPRASQRNGVTTDAEPAFEGSPEGVRLVSQYGEKWTQPVVTEIGAATGIEFLDRRHGHGHGDHGHHGPEFLAAAEPVRRGGGSAAVVRPER